MGHTSRAGMMWAAVALAAIVALVYFSEAAMTWLRVTLHGR